MALGSSAPEILLAIIEASASNFQPAELGPSTIVGSAAFNLLVITGFCIYGVKGTNDDGTPQYKRINEYGVFIITAMCSLFAQFWMWFCLDISSPNVIEAWEGWLTLLFFPLLVLLAWVQDKGWRFGTYNPE